jgi:hypothetical protein
MSTRCDRHSLRIQFLAENCEHVVSCGEFAAPLGALMSGTEVITGFTNICATPKLDYTAFVCNMKISVYTVLLVRGI